MGPINNYNWLLSGLILENGDINWNCPCLGGMATGPCGPEFREAFSCFHHSQADPKGSDCFEQFRTMQECMTKYPSLYDYDDKKEGQELFPEEDMKDNTTTDTTPEQSEEKKES